MIKCPSCGNNNNDGEAFCAFCAAILPMAQKEGAPASSATGPSGTGTIPVPKAVETSAATNEDTENASDPELLDPLDQFIKSKKDPENLKVETIGNFVADFDHLEDQLDDAHRAEVMKAQMAALHRKEAQAANLPQGKDKLDQLDALLDSEFEKAAELARKEKEAAEAKKAESESKNDKLEKLEKYQKYLDVPESQPSAASGGNDLIRYLETKVNQQAIEIENLKRQKQELVQEVFSDALNDERDETKEKYERAQKEIEKLELEVKMAKNKKADLEERLLAKSSQIEQLLAEKASGSDKIQLAKSEVAATYERKIVELTAQLKNEQTAEASLKGELVSAREQLKRQTDMIMTLRKNIEESEKKLANVKAAEQTLKEGFETQIEQLKTELDSAQSSSEEAPKPAEIERYKTQIKALQERVKKTMTTGSTQLKSLASYYELILNRMNELILVFDRNKHVLFLNSTVKKLCNIDDSQTINCNLADIASLAPLEDAATEAAKTNSPLTGEGIVVDFPELNNSRFRPDFYPIQFPGKEAVLLVLSKVEETQSATSSKQISIEQLCSIKEQLFSLKILAEIIYKKRDVEKIVEESSEELTKELETLLNSL